MQRFGRLPIAIPVALMALAGFVDAVAFSALGFFVAAIGGTSVRLGVALSGGWDDLAATGVTLLLAFLAGVIAASVVAGAFARRSAAVLVLISLLLLLAVLASHAVAAPVVVAITAAAMGALHLLIARDGGSAAPGGALLALGDKLAAALTGEGARWDWLPDLVLWVGFVAGAIIGAGWFARLGLSALWIAVVAAVILTAIVARVAPTSDRATAEPV